MAITFVNKSAFASGTAGLTVGAVASTQADDLILLFVESANENIATPTGYTQVTGSPVSTGTAAAAGGVRLAVFYRWATGADSTTSVADSGNHTTAIKIAYRGVDTATPFDATPVTGIKTPASTSSSFPGITTTTANAKIVHASGLDLDAASTATTGAATNANLTGITEHHDQTISGGVGGGLVIIEGSKATAGAAGNTTATVTSTIQVYLTMALRELVLAARAGDLAATEAGVDTAALSGDVVVQGVAAATEPAGDDAFTASGALSSGIAGTLAVTETGSDTTSASGDVFISGALSATESDSDTAALAGNVFVSGALAASEVGSDTATASGDVVVVGSMSAVEVGQDAAVLSGVLLIQGDLAVTEFGEDVFQASSDSGVSGDMAAVESGDDVAGFIQEQVIPAQRRAGGRRGYIFKGKRYWLNQFELAQLIREEQARISDVQRLKRNKPKTISAETAKAIDAIIASLNLPAEPIQQTITHQIDNDDDEAIELLMTL